MARAGSTGRSRPTLCTRSVRRGTRRTDLVHKVDLDQVSGTPRAPRRGRRTGRRPADPARPTLWIRSVRRGARRTDLVHKVDLEQLGRGAGCRAGGWRGAGSGRGARQGLGRPADLAGPADPAAPGRPCASDPYDAAPGVRTWCTKWTSSRWRACRGLRANPGTRAGRGTRAGPGVDSPATAARGRPRAPDPYDAAPGVRIWCTKWTWSKWRACRRLSAGPGRGGGRRRGLVGSVTGRRECEKSRSLTGTLCARGGS